MGVFLLPTVLWLEKLERAVGHRLRVKCGRSKLWSLNVVFYFWKLAFTQVITKYLDQPSCPNWSFVLNKKAGCMPVGTASVDNLITIKLFLFLKVSGGYIVIVETNLITKW